MKKTTYLLLILMSMTFLSGAAIGFFAGRLTAPKRSRKHRKFMRSKKEMKSMFQRHICKRLKLNDEQKKLAQPLIEQWLEEIDKLRQLHTPQYTLAFNKFYAQIELILSTEQKETLKKMHKKFTKHSPPPPPPPSKEYNKRSL